MNIGANLGSELLGINIFVIVAEGTNQQMTQYLELLLEKPAVEAKVKTIVLTGSG